MICSVAGCSGTVRARGWCAMHYARWRTSGDPGEASPRSLLGVSPEERIARRTTRTDGHWLWTGTITPNGYGSLSVHGKVHFAHRFVYETLVGPIPAGMQLDHLCRIRHCVYPAHLEPVTCAENLRRGARQTATTCRFGHPLDGRKSGVRYCKTCHRERERARRARKAAA